MLVVSIFIASLIICVILYSSQRTPMLCNSRRLNCTVSTLS